MRNRLSLLGRGRRVLLRRSSLPILMAGLLLPVATASTAAASTLTLSSLSSDSTPASLLDATLVFMITGASELTLSVTNDTVAPNAYFMNGVWFNAAAHVTGLSLVSATHSDAGDVTAAWDPVETGSQVDGFGNFAYGLTDSVGLNNPNMIGPGETVDFILAISGTGPYDMADFVFSNDQGLSAAGKFVSGPGDDSAFGAVPEPGTAALVGSGLLGLVLAGRRRR